MTISDNGATRESQAVKSARKRRARRTAEKNSRFASTAWTASGAHRKAGRIENGGAGHPATRIGDGLKQLAGEAADLPIGAVVLLSDGADNSGGNGSGYDPPHFAAGESRSHTVGFGLEQAPRDIEINDAVVPPRALADSRLGRQGQFSSARLRRTESHADGSRWQ